MNKRWIIVSNRLPVQYDTVKKRMMPASGGLVSALSNIRTSNKTIWVGTAPGTSSGVKFDDGLVPVRVDVNLYDKYYNGMSNDVLWPLFHYESGYVKYKADDFEAYKRVNQKFADRIAKFATTDDLIWVHDFHLLMLPAMLKAKNKKFKVGFFLHIPFPSSEIFRQLPIGKELLEGMVKADLIGFHDYSYLRHFNSTLHLMLGLESTLLSAKYKGHQIQFGVFPVSIDTKKFQKKALAKDVTKLLASHRQQKTSEKLILGVDRLDYIKGIDLKLRAFREFLRLTPSARGKVSLLQIAVPSRIDVPEYIRLKNTIESLVGEINGKFGRSHYVPVRYLFATVSFTELVALYKLADVLFVSSKRDGMNLVSFEYIAAQKESDPGVVVLSEFAGAIATLSNVVSINPWNIRQTASRLGDALNMQKSLRVANHRPMIDYLKQYTATQWADSFLSRLDKAYIAEVQKAETIEYTPSRIKLPSAISKRRVRAKKVLLFVDYDGTLVPICQTPSQAVLGKLDKKIIQQLCKRNSLEIVIVSGRDSKFLKKQFAGIPITMSFEHGAKFQKHNMKEPVSLVSSNINAWYKSAYLIMNDYSYRVPGSFVEKKDFALAWHFRTSPSDFAEYQARKLKEELEVGLSNLPVTIMHGKKVIEARAIEGNKGSFLRWYLDQFYKDDLEQTLICAIGDDATDEQMFDVVNPIGISVKIGSERTNADYRLENQEKVLPLIMALAKK